MKRARTIVLALAVAGGALPAAGAAPGADGAPVPSAAAPIVVGIGAGGGPYVTAYDQAGNWRTGFLPYFDFYVGGLHVAAGDVDGDGRADLVTVPGRGGRAEIRTFDASGERKGPTLYTTPSNCGTRIAVGDVNGDRTSDLVAGSEECNPNVQIFDGATRKRIAFFSAFGNGGIRVAAGDVTGDGKAEVITAAARGDVPTVRIYPGTPSSSSPQPLLALDAFGPTVRSGLEIAAADVTGDAKAEVIVAAETPDDAQIKIFDGSGRLLKTFFPFGLVSAGTLRLAAGDVDGDGGAEIVVSAESNSTRSIRIFSPAGAREAELEPPLYNGSSLAAADFDGDGAAEIAMSSGPGDESTVAVMNASGAVSASFQAYGNSFTHGVRVAAGDLDGNGVLEYVTGQGPGGTSQLLALDSQGNALRELYPFGESWQGLYVAAGDLDGDAKCDIVAGAGQGEPLVKTYDGQGRERDSFLAFEPAFQGGVRVATGDVRGNDGKAEIVVAPGPGGPPAVRVFDASGTRLLSFFAFDAEFTGGVYVAAGDLFGDGVAEIVVGSGTTGDVRVFDWTGQLQTSFVAYEPSSGFFDGVHVAVGDVDGDGKAEIVTGPGAVRPVDVRIFDGTGSPRGTIRANSDFQGGIYVATPAPLGRRLEHALAHPARAVEGRPLRLRATFVDPRGGAAPERFGADIHWGDGKTSRGAISALGEGRYAIEGVHTYSSFGRFDMSVRIADVFLRGTVVATSATVRDAPLVARGRAVRTSELSFAGVVATLRDGDRFGLAADLRAGIAWGDGSRSSARIEELGRGRFHVVGRHRFRSPGVYRAIVTIQSRGGSTASATTRISVRR